MKKLLLPLLLLLIGTGGGVGAALFMAPAADEEHAELLSPCGDVAADGEHGEPAAEAHAETGAEAPVPVGEDGAPLGREYARMNNQFVVPVVEAGRISALVVLSITVEVTTGHQEEVYLNEPRLRDEFLQVFFDHANAGGFEGVFTSSANMRGLRTALRRAARQSIGPDVTDVLITDIVRQDN